VRAGALESRERRLSDWAGSSGRNRPERTAARTKVLSVGQILTRLDDSLKVLVGKDRTAPERQRTPRGALDWSYELLEEPERKLLGRLSVFAGGFSLEAAEAVGSTEGIEDGDGLEVISGLVDKSMVVAEAGLEGTLRYRMLEPVRQYGLERLEGGGETEEVCERHAAFSSRWLRRPSPS
jgi:predicted ATPase